MRSRDFHDCVCCVCLCVLCACFFVVCVVRVCLCVCERVYESYVCVLPTSYILYFYRHFNSPA